MPCVCRRSCDATPSVSKSTGSNAVKEGSEEEEDDGVFSSHVEAPCVRSDDAVVVVCLPWQLRAIIAHADDPPGLADDSKPRRCTSAQRRMSAAMFPTDTRLVAPLGPDDATGLAAACVASLPAWRQDTTVLRDALEAAGWQCAACSVDDVSRRVEWRG